jgi:hypothetical protein
LGQWKKNSYTRHVLRLTVPSYHESLLSLIYPGDRQAFEWFKPALQALEEQWSWSPLQRQQVIVRTDAGLGTDANINYALWQQFQVLMKGFSGKRTQAWVKLLDQPPWLEDVARLRAITPAPAALRFGRRTHNYLLRWISPTGKLSYATLISSLLDLDPLPTLRLYDGRGADEGEIGSDKTGLLLPKRRKHSLAAQEALVLLTDVAHNLLAWLHPWALQDTPLAGFGPQRLVNDVLSIPGHLDFEHGRLVKVSLWQAHPYAKPVQIALVTLLRYFDLPAVMGTGKV